MESFRKKICLKNPENKDNKNQKSQIIFISQKVL